MKKWRMIYTISFPVEIEAEDSVEALARFAGLPYATATEQLNLGDYFNTVVDYDVGSLEPVE